MENTAGKSLNASVLLSGGIDSTACLHYYLEQGVYVRAVHISYGQLAAANEFTAAKSITDHFNVNLNLIDFKAARLNKKDYICGRNAFLIVTALMEFPESNIIAIGIHAGTNYSDCTPRFVEKMQSVCDIYSKGTIQIATPFINWTKREIYEYCRENKLPLHMTYSCEYGKEQPCGMCLSCRDLEALTC